MSDFTHLHLHTEYSLLDGANKIDELAGLLKSQGVKSVAMTDHGNMFGAIDFYKTMKKNGIKPIIGMETYLHNHDDISDKSDRQRFHLILLAKNEVGYKNLMYLSSIAYIDGFYFNPRINKKLLREHSEGLVCTSACLQGEVSFHLNLSERNVKRGAKGYEAAKAAALEYKEIFGDDFYLEIMRHGIEDQYNIDKQILQIAKETGIKVVASNDAHYPYKERAEAHEVFMCIAMAKNLDDPDRLRHEMKELYVKTSDEMSKIFADIPEAITHTQEIVDKCNLELDLGHPTPPNFKFTLEEAKKEGLTLPNPELEDDLENDKVLFEHLSKKGLEERLKFIDEEKHAEYKERLEKEIEIINSMRFPGYMLIVSDFINYAKKQGIPVGPGRGSAAGSLVSYALKITDIDPIPYSLLFERFLNPERISMPDIDVDFCQERRGEVIEYVIDKYGEYNVAQVATFGKLLAKGVIRDVARVCGMPYAEADKMAKLIPDQLGITLNGKGEAGSEKYKPGAFQLEPKIKELIENDTGANRVWKFALDLEGLNRNAGMHAAGVVISNEELWNKTPLFRQTNSGNGHLITQYTKDYLEDVDLIKFDFLGLKTLTVINDAMKLVKMRYGKEIVWEEIDVNTKEVYKTISSGNTLGIFQIESGGMQKLATDLKPDNFEDVIAMIALYRPGPMDLIPEFCDRKHGKSEISYIIDDIKDILEPTYGIVVYQEQVMEIVQRIGGFSLGGADIVRRAMSKKIESEMIKIREEYLKGAVKKGYNEKKANELFDMIMSFADYGFNKSHAAAYTMITFQTAYLKTFYPAEFMAALLTSEENNLDKVAKYIDEIKRLNIEILPPSINESIRQFSAVEHEGKDAIVFGMGAIKGVGGGAIENIVREREANGAYRDVNDFASRIDNFKVNKRALDGLIKSGAMDCLNLSRKMLLQNVDNITEASKNAAKMASEMENSLFADFEEVGEVEVKLDIIDSEYEQKQLLKLEKESLGIYLSGHPLDDYKNEIDGLDYTLSSEFDELADITETLVIGKIEELDIKITKRGSKMGILNILDLHGNFEMVVFDKLLGEIESLDVEEMERPHAFRVRIERDEAQYKISLNEFVKNLDGAKELGGVTRSYARRNNFKKEPKKVLGEVEYFIRLDDLNSDIINQIYNLAHKSNSTNNSKRLILKVEAFGKLFVFETDFFVDDEFGQNLSEILVA
ncbi:MAG: DNA polymerase III subunit alpha [Campylobacteraceae bacterium]|nr:DNA polymerase III subunit alpha [Campylobacteraceae bacterium]